MGISPRVRLGAIAGVLVDELVRLARKWQQRRAVAAAIARSEGSELQLRRLEARDRAMKAIAESARSSPLGIAGPTLRIRVPHRP